MSVSYVKSKEEFSASFDELCNRNRGSFSIDPSAALGRFYEVCGREPYTMPSVGVLHRLDALVCALEEKAVEYPNDKPCADMSGLGRKFLNDAYPKLRTSYFSKPGIPNKKLNGEMLEMANRLEFMMFCRLEADARISNPSHEYSPTEEAEYLFMDKFGYKYVNEGLGEMSDFYRASQLIGHIRKNEDPAVIKQCDLWCQILDEIEGRPEQDPNVGELTCEYDYQSCYVSYNERSWELFQLANDLEKVFIQHLHSVMESDALNNSHKWMEAQNKTQPLYDAIKDVTIQAWDALLDAGVHVKSVAIGSDFGSFIQQNGDSKKEGVATLLGGGGENMTRLIAPAVSIVVGKQHSTDGENVRISDCMYDDKYRARAVLDFEIDSKGESYKERLPAFLEQVKNVESLLGIQPLPERDGGLGRPLKATRKNIDLGMGR